MWPECLWWAPQRCGMAPGPCSHALQHRHLQIIDDRARAAMNACASMRAYTPAHEVECLCLAVRSVGDSADGKTMNIFSSSTKNPMVLLDLSSRASPYQPAGNTGVTDILPSWPFCAWQRASRVQRIRSKLCCNLPTGADYHQGDQSFKKRHFRIQMATFESIRKSLLAKTVTKLVPCILNLSVS